MHKKIKIVMDDVMNNTDLRGVIWSFLRTEAEINCHGCKKVLVWDKKKVDRYFTYHHGKCLSHYCYDCWGKTPSTGCVVG